MYFNTVCHKRIINIYADKQEEKKMASFSLLPFYNSYRWV